MFLVHFINIVMVTVYNTFQINYGWNKSRRVIIEVFLVNIWNINVILNRDDSDRSYSYENMKSL